jgi:hypothetical protein
LKRSSISEFELTALMGLSISLTSFTITSLTLEGMIMDSIEREKEGFSGINWVGLIISHLLYYYFYLVIYRPRLDLSGKDSDSSIRIPLYPLRFFAYVEIRRMLYLSKTRIVHLVEPKLRSLSHRIIFVKSCWPLQRMYPSPHSRSIHLLFPLDLQLF